MLLKNIYTNSFPKLIGNNVFNAIDSCDNAVDLIETQTGYTIVELTTQCQTPIWVFVRHLDIDTIAQIRAAVNAHNSLVVA